jgi:hypothetical protein
MSDPNSPSGKGSGTAGGDGRAGQAAHHPGQGASLAESPPRLGPAPAAADDAGPGLAEAGSPHGPTPANRGQGPEGGAGGDVPAERATGAGAAGISGDEAPGRITGRGQSGPRSP